MFGQQRSQSGPGGLSINTNSANVFPNSNNNTSQAPQAGGLLFAAKPNPNPFAPPIATQSTQGGGLFGTATSAPNQAGGLFGSQTNTLPTTSSGSTGLFGGSSSNVSTATNIFGSLGQSQNQTHGQQQQQPVPGINLMGASGQNQNQNSSQQKQTSNLFSGAVNQSKPSISSGNPQPPTFASQPSAMGSLQQPQRNVFSTSIGQYSQQQQSVPGVRVDLSGLRLTTRFNDLYEDVQKVVEGVDNFVLSQIAHQETCEQVMPRIESIFSYIPNDVEFCSQKLDALQQSLESDADHIESSKNLVKKDAADARLSFKSIQNLRVPQQFQHASLWNVPAAPQSVNLNLPDGDVEEGASVNLVSYFSKQADEMSKTLESYKRSVEEVEAYLRGMEANTNQQVQRVQFTRGRDGGERSADDQVRELAAVLREFENGILGVADKLGGAREQVQAVMLGEGIGRSSRHGPY